MKHLKKFNEAKKPSPKKITKLDYSDMMKFLEKKYNFESRGFTGIPSQTRSESIPYMDYWHYLCDINEVGNGSYIYIPREVDKTDELTPQKSIEMFRYLLDQELKRKNPDKEHIENCKELIRREEEALKNPKVDPWEGWEQKITDLIFKEFGEFAKNDSLKVWVEW